METERIEKIRQGVETLAQNAERLASQGDGFPAIMQNTQRLKACIRMMEIALGQVSMTTEKKP